MNYHDVVGTQPVNFKSVHGLKCVQKMSSVNFVVVVKYLYNDQLIVVNSRCKNGRLQRPVGRCKKRETL